MSPIGTVLLVVDSPGSYSETTVGKSSKKYPMQWLMDKVLSSVDGERKWNKLESNESLWYRLSDGLEYPISWRICVIKCMYTSWRRAMEHEVKNRDR